MDPLSLVVAGTVLQQETRWFWIQCHHLSVQVWTDILIVLNTSTYFNTFYWAFQAKSWTRKSLSQQETQSYCIHIRITTLTLTVTSKWEVRTLDALNRCWCNLSELTINGLNVVVSCVCEFINLFPTVFCSVGAVHTFFFRLVINRKHINGDQQKEGWNHWRNSKGNLWLWCKAPSRSFVTNEDTLIPV
jgi:hypothetical protein